MALCKEDVRAIFSSGVILWDIIKPVSNHDIWQIHALASVIEALISSLNAYVYPGGKCCQRYKHSQRHKRTKDITKQSIDYWKVEWLYYVFAEMHSIVFMSSKLLLENQDSTNSFVSVYQNIDAKTQYPPFCRQHFQKIFLFTNCHVLKFQWSLFSMQSSNGWNDCLAPNKTRDKPLSIRANDSLFYWHKFASLSLIYVIEMYINI